jgi:hypothetical protein
MKNLRYIILCWVVVLLGSCVKDEPNIFSTSPAERLSNAMKTDKDSLISSNNGWVMEYFATTASGGYTLLVKFNKSGQAIIAGKSELTGHVLLSDSSLYDMIGDDGPVLTFNSYNKVLHAFSTPESPDGYGLQGDYEFIVMKNTADQIILKGKKRNTTILLNRLPQSITWEQYFAGLDAMDSLLFYNNALKLKMSIGTSTYSFTNGANHIFSIAKDGVGVNIPIDAPFIVTRTGIRFQSEQEIDGVKFQTLILSEDKSALVSMENPDLKLTGVTDLATFFADNINVWQINPAELSSNVKALYDQIVQSCVSKYSAKDVKLALRYYATRRTFELTLSYVAGSVLNEGNLDFALNASSGNLLTLYYKGTGDTNGLVMYNDVAGLKDLSALISTGFTLSTASMINPQKIVFTKRTDANTWMSLSMQ